MIHYTVSGMSQSNMFTVNYTVFQLDQLNGQIHIYGVNRGMNSLYKYNLVAMVDTKVYGIIYIETTVITPPIFVIPALDTTSTDSGGVAMPVDP